MDGHSSSPLVLTFEGQGVPPDPVSCVPVKEVSSTPSRKDGLPSSQPGTEVPTTESSSTSSEVEALEVSLAK